MAVRYAIKDSNSAFVRYLSWDMSGTRNIIIRLS